MVANPPHDLRFAPILVSLGLAVLSLTWPFASWGVMLSAGEPPRPPAATESANASPATEAAAQSPATQVLTGDSPQDEYQGRPNEYGVYGRVGSAAYPRYTTAGQYRQPVDIKFVDDSTALITTKLSGEIWELKWSADNYVQSSLRSVYQATDCSWGTVIALEPNVVAVTESQSEQVVLFLKSAAGWEKTIAFDTPGGAHSLLWDPLHRRLLASGQWSQQLFRWQAVAADLSDQDSWQRLSVVDLQMCGGEMLLLPKQNMLLITDAFGSNYRLLDRDSGNVIKRERVYGHNISGLAATHQGTMVLFPHQLLSETAPSVQGEITWGGVLSNNLRWLQVDRLREQSGHDIIRQGRFYPLGTNGDGCGDPSSLAVSSSGLLAITLGGTNRVALVTEDEYYFRQVDVGLRPVACAFSPDEQAVIVVNQFSDSLSVVRLSDDQVQHISLGAIRHPTQIERGEQAFFDSSLSHDGWMSCHSCHSHGHTSGQLNDNLTDKSFGSPKRILSLLGQAETAPYSWNGHLKDLESQVAHSINSTMAGDREADAATVADLAAYVRSLPAPPSLTEARRLKADRSLNDMPHTSPTAQPSQLFRELGCVDCHSGRWMTSSGTYAVGLADGSIDESIDGAEEGFFNPPSLIGVSQRQDVLLHDGRAGSLRNFLEQHSHQLTHELTQAEVDELVAYLQGL